MGELIRIITASEAAVRDRSLDAFCGSASAEELVRECDKLDRFRRDSENLYERVRALLFLYAIHRFHLPEKVATARQALIPFGGYANLLKRRFEEAIDIFLAAQMTAGPSAAISSALAEAYRGLAFQTLADQVRQSVRSVRGNQWMFRTGHTADYPLRLRSELRERAGAEKLFPVLHEATPVRMDLTHSGWSDIFFLGMDFPEGARVLIAEISTIAEVFDFARDYLGLLKAAVIAAGIVPPGLEGAGQPLAGLLATLVGMPGHGVEIVSRVNDIPKGSRLAVSTSLLACLITVCMRATGQTRALTGPLAEPERRLVAARAILGEWLGGSGGGWQDSGGVWPGIKLIQGVKAGPGDPEYGVSRGCLLPRRFWRWSPSGTYCVRRRNGGPARKPFACSTSSSASSRRET